MPTTSFPCAPCCGGPCAVDMATCNSLCLPPPETHFGSCTSTPGQLSCDMYVGLKKSTSRTVSGVCYACHWVISASNYIAPCSPTPCVNPPFAGSCALTWTLINCQKNVAGCCVAGSGLEWWSFSGSCPASASVCGCSVPFAGASAGCNRPGNIFSQCHYVK